MFFGIGLELLGATGTAEVVILAGVGVCVSGCGRIHVHPAHWIFFEV
jgi:hypothetical protein